MLAVCLQTLADLDCSFGADDFCDSHRICLAVAIIFVTPSSLICYVYSRPLCCCLSFCGDRDTSSLLSGVFTKTKSLTIRFSQPRPAARLAVAELYR